VVAAAKGSWPTSESEIAKMKPFQERIMWAQNA